MVGNNIFFFTVIRLVVVHVVRRRSAKVIEHAIILLLSERARAHLLLDSATLSHIAWQKHALEKSVVWMFFLFRLLGSFRAIF